jgi:hypothetical protein
MNLLTIGDFYRKRYGKSVEVLTSLAIAASYVGWTSAQLTAIGLMTNVLTHGEVSIDTGHSDRCSGVVLIYTVWGGMISGGLYRPVSSPPSSLLGSSGIAWYVGDLAGGAGVVLAAAQEAGRLEFFPRTAGELVGVQRRVPHDGAGFHPAAGCVSAGDQRAR